MGCGGIARTDEEEAMSFSIDSTHGLARCTSCAHPVAAPVGLLDRQLFHVPHCPGCGCSFPHPTERAELRNAKRTAVFGAVLVAVAVTAMQITTMQQLSLLV